MKKHFPSGSSLKIETGKILRTNSSSNLRKKTPISPNNSNSQQRLSSRHLSPFQQVTSKSSIYKNMLPTFCRIPNSPTNPKPAHFNLTQEKLKPIKVKSLKSNIYLEISKTIMSSSQLDYSIKIFDLILDQNDLMSFKPENILTQNAIESSFKIMIKKNLHRIYQKSKPLKQAYIVPLPICQQLFHSDLSEVPHKSIEKFELIFFPIYFDYWNLAICDITEKTIKFFDPVGIDSDDLLIKTKIRNYLSGIRRENKVSVWKFKYENITETEVYDHIDSSIYILMQIYKSCVKPDFSITPENIEEFRIKLLYYTYKYGTKVN